MHLGTIYVSKNNSSCEIVVFPETADTIERTTEAIREAGFLVEAEAPYIGNIAIHFSEDKTLQDLQGIITGEIIS